MPSRVGSPDARELFRGPLPHELAPFGSAFGSQVDDPVGAFDHIQIVLDHNDRIARVNQLLKNTHQFADIIKMQAGRGFVEDVKGAARCSFREFSG